MHSRQETSRDLVDAFGPAPLWSAQEGRALDSSARLCERPGREDGKMGDERRDEASEDEKRGEQREVQYGRAPRLGEPPGSRRGAARRPPRGKS